MWRKIKLIQTLSKSVIPARFKNEGARVVIIDRKSMQIFYDAQGKLTP